MKQFTSLLVLILLFIGVNSQAQYVNDYVPLKYSSSGFKMSQSAFEKKYKFKYNTNDKSMIKKFDQYLYVLYKTYSSGSKDKQFIDEAFVKRYVNRIMDSILSRNHIKDKIDVIVTRYAVPNAFNMGDNKLYINIGLLEQLDNEAQIAFVLCHELSHQLLFHVQDNFIANEKLAKSKVVKKEIRDINKAKYNKLDKTFQFMKNYSYEFTKYSRANEKSADSMAIVLLNNTDYDLRESNTLMKILDHADDDSTQIDYSKYFENNDSHDLKSEWLKTKKSSLVFGNKKEYEFDKDSIKTHPDIPVRIKMIDTQLTKLNYDPSKKTKFVQSQALFDSVCNASKFEIIESYVKRKRYGAIFYYSVKLMKQFPENKYLYKNAAIALHELNKAIKKHTVQNFIPIESDEDFSEGYNQLLRIIDRTTADEFNTLTKNFINRYYSKISTYPEIQSIYDAFNKK